MFVTLCDDGEKNLVLHSLFTNSAFWEQRMAQMSLSFFLFAHCSFMYEHYPCIAIDLSALLLCISIRLRAATSSDASL